MSTASGQCCLCQGTTLAFFGRDAWREYWRCSACHLVLVPPQFHISSAEEKAEYDLHENDPFDAGYRRFLERLAAPLRSRLQPGALGLDFGCGPGPTLSVMLEEAGFQVELYDPFYAHDLRVFENRYDFVTATEVVEHLAAPRLEFERLWSLLPEGGVLAIMTKLVTTQEAFARWHYKNDKTHISFFSRETFVWLAARWEAKVEFVGSDVIILEKI